ncbi:MAG: hypothetical protein ACHQUC_02900, partial [Chlamydiales bacterium]
MLFRCSQTFYWGLVLTLTSSTLFSLEADQKSFKKEGKEFSQEERTKWLDFANTTLADELTPPDLKGKSFNAEEAEKQSINQENLPVNEYLQDVRLLRYREYQPDEETLKRSDQAIEDFNQGIIEQKTESSDYTLKKCLQEDTPFELEVRHTLNVKMTHVPEVKKICKICKEHKSKRSYTWKADAENAVERKNKKFAADPTIKSYHVKISGGGVFSDYTVRSHWIHHDDVADCDSYHAEEKTMSAERWDSE